MAPGTRSDPTERNIGSQLLTVIQVLLCLILVGLTFKDITTIPLNGDEAFSTELALMPWHDAWTHAVGDYTHPPMFTMLLKLWMAIGGHSLLWLRLLPVAASCLLLAPFFLLVHEFQVPRAASVLGLAAVVANGTRFYYTHVVRSYSIMMLLSAFSLWLFARNTRREKVSRGETIAFWLVNLLMCWMHYFGFWVVAVEFLLAAFVFRKELLRVLVSGLMVAASCLLWVPSAARIARAQRGLNGLIGWMGRPSLGDLPWSYHALIGAPEVPHLVLVGFVLFFLPLAIWCVQAVRRPAKLLTGDQRILVLFLPQVTIPVFGTFVLSWFGPTNLFAPRVLMFTIVPYCLLIGCALVRIPIRPLKIALCCALVAWTGSAIYASTRRMAHSDPRWDVIADCVASTSEAATPARSVEIFTPGPYNLYLRLSGRTVAPVVQVPAFDPSLPDRFWAAFRDFHNQPGYAAKLESDLRSLGYIPGKRCISSDRDTFSVVFELESRTAPAGR